MRRWSAVVVFGAVLSCSASACFLGADDLGDECDFDGDCPATGDPCTVSKCFAGVCSAQEQPRTAACECITNDDCNRANDTACQKTRCNVDHVCVEELAPAGPALDQTPHDCASLVCDGQHALPTEVPDDLDAPPDEAGDCSAFACAGGTVTTVADEADVPPDPPCGKASCNGAVATYVTEADGTACGSGGLCFLGSCLTGCTPSAPTACGAEGPNEPANDSAATASSFDDPLCGFLDATDDDWFTFYAQDRDFRTNILRFAAWSSAPTIELCAYVKCTDGTAPDGGCSDKVAGPDGSSGCCWTGASEGFVQYWDLDCGTVEDSGDVFVSVRSTAADTCDTYAVTMSY